MSDVPRWRRYLRFARPNVAADVDEELQFHINMRVERNLALGMSAEDARRDALVRFGDVALVKDALVQHDSRKQAAAGRREYLMDFVQDLRFGWRSLRSAPAFALAAILTLALGIGANAAIFSVVDAIILRPLPFAQPERLVSIGQGSGGEFVALRERLRSVSGLAAYVGQTHPIDDGEEALRVEGVAITSNLLKLLGVAPLLGRDFTEADAQPGNNTVLLISHSLWQQRFGGSPDVIGKRTTVEGTPFTIIGVMPPEFHFPDKSAQYWQPYAFDLTNVGFHWAVGGKAFIGRLAHGVSLAQAQRDVRDVWPSLRRLNPLWDPGPEYGRNARVVPLQHEVVGDAGRVVWILFGCVLVVLLVGCVNVANLLLARATARERELSVRAALGGGRGRLVRQLVTESLLLSSLGAALGIGVALVAVRWMVTVLPDGVPRAHEITVNGPVLLFTAAIAVVTGILFGAIPAFRAMGAAGALGGITGGRTTRGVQHQRVSGALVVAELALAVLLVIGAGLLLRSFAAVRNIAPGFNTTHVVAARITPPGTTYRVDMARVTSLYTSIVDRLSAMPGVQSAATVDKLPLAQRVWGLAARIEGQYEDASKLLPEIDHWQMVTPRYFETMGIPLQRGRMFGDADRADQPPVAIVSSSVARRFWPNAEPIGKRVGYPYNSTWITIVGVVPDTKQDSLRDTTALSMYVPLQQRTRMSGSEMWVVARSTLDPGQVGDAIRSIVRDVDRTVPVSDIRTLDAVVARSMQKEQFTVVLVGGFALAALLLGAVGIYGVMSYLVSQRTREMGVRMALGAHPSDVIGLVVGRAARLAAAGAILGIVAALVTTRSLRALLYGVSASDPLTYASVAALFVVIAVLASYAPALRATRVDPVRTLRAE